MSPPAVEDADEATAEAIINVALQSARDAFARYDGGWTTRLELIGALQAAIARAEHEALQAGWSFLFRTATQADTATAPTSEEDRLRRLVVLWGQTLVAEGRITINELRAAIGLEPCDGGRGAGAVPTLRPNPLAGGYLDGYRAAQHQIEGDS